MSKLNRSQPSWPATSPPPPLSPPRPFHRQTPPPPSPTSSPTVPAGVATSATAMPWQLDGFVAERLEKCRQLLEAAEAAGGQGDAEGQQAQQADMRVWVEYADLIVALHRTALDERGRGRSALSPGERVQVRAGSNAELMPIARPTAQILQPVDAPRTGPRFPTPPTAPLPWFPPLPAPSLQLCVLFVLAISKHPLVSLGVEPAADPVLSLAVSAAGRHGRLERA